MIDGQSSCLSGIREIKREDLHRDTDMKMSRVCAVTWQRVAANRRESGILFG